MTTLAKAVYEYTPDEAGFLFEAADRKLITLSPAERDDLMLVASGHAALVEDAERRPGPKSATCVVCGKSFQPLRASARYCREACRAKASRTRAKTAASR